MSARVRGGARDDHRCSGTGCGSTGHLCRPRTRRRSLGRSRAVALVERTRPDVALTDLAMLASTARLPRGRSLQLPGDRRPRVDHAGRQRGPARALRPARRATCSRTPHARRSSAPSGVAAGTVVYSGPVARRIVGLVATARTTTRRTLSGVDRPRSEILDLLATGIGNHEIARRLFLSRKTVRNNVGDPYELAVRLCRRSRPRT